MSRGQVLLPDCLPASLPQGTVTECPCWTLDTEGPENPVLGFRELLPQAGAGMECRKTEGGYPRSPPGMMTPGRKPGCNSVGTGAIRAQVGTRGQEKQVPPGHQVLG